MVVVKVKSLSTQNYLNKDFKISLSVKVTYKKITVKIL